MPVAPCVPNFSWRSILPSPSVSRRPRMNPGSGGCPCTVGPLRTVTKMSPFGATTRLRAVPRLSAMTPAQKPAGSVNPPLSLSQAKPLGCPCVVAAPATQPMIDAPMDRCFIAPVTDLRAAVILFSSNRFQLLAHIFSRRRAGPSEVGRTLKSEPHSAVDVAAVERRPGVNGPAAVDTACRPQERLPACLPDIREVLAVDEQQRAADTTGGEKAEHAVGPAFRAIGVGVQPLRACIEPLDTEARSASPFPRGVQADAMPRRQRHVDPAFVGGFT